MTPIDVSGRVTGIADGLAALDGGRGVDAILVSDLTNIGWLTGFSGSNGWVIVKPDELVLVTDGRYGAQAERQLDTSGAGSGLPTRIEVGSSGAQMLALVGAALADVGRLAFESAHIREGWLPKVSPKWSIPRNCGITCSTAVCCGSSAFSTTWT